MKNSILAVLTIVMPLMLNTAFGNTSNSPTPLKTISQCTGYCCINGVHGSWC